MQAMDPHAADCQTAMYCNRYPSVEGKEFPEGALRIGAHTDFELLTLLFTRPGAATCSPACFTAVWSCKMCRIAARIQPCSCISLAWMQHGSSVNHELLQCYIASKSPSHVSCSLVPALSLILHALLTATQTNAGCGSIHCKGAAHSVTALRAFTVKS